MDEDPHRTFQAFALSAETSVQMSLESDLCKKKKKHSVSYSMMEQTHVKNEPITFQNSQKTKNLHDQLFLMIYYNGHL